MKWEFPRAFTRSIRLKFLARTILKIVQSEYLLTRWIIVYTRTGIARSRLLRLSIRRNTLETCVDSVSKRNRCWKRHDGDINFIQCFANSILSRARKFAFVAMHYAVIFSVRIAKSTIVSVIIVVAFKEHKLCNFDLNFPTERSFRRLEDHVNFLFN